ncbi:MAG: GWxTD domain-containing protein [Bacteroidota bacterium]
MKRIQSILLAGLLLLCSQRADAQAAELKPSQAEPAVLFFFDAISYASSVPGKSRIEVFIQVPYEQLRFVKDGETFSANYDVVLTVEKPSHQILQERSWSVDVRLPEFARTVSRNSASLSQKAIEIEPGEYHLIVLVKDTDSKKTGKIQRSVLVTDFAKDSLSLSDIMLVSRLTTEGNKRKIVPNISGMVSSSGDGFFLFFEVYGGTPDDSITFTWKIFNQEKKEVSSRVQAEPTPTSQTQVFVKVEDLLLPIGTYLVTVETEVPMKATTSRTFTVRWADLPPSIKDLSKAVDQLRYIAQPTEYDHIRKAETDEEVRKRFLEFWTKRDPDPQTQRNELMEEYYQRVEYANKTFSHYMEGWRTDRGMVFIRFGTPDNIERHPFDMNSKPYEVWYYYEVERQFVFVDETGFGDYRLRYPTTDLWGRIR